MTTPGITVLVDVHLISLHDRQEADTEVAHSHPHGPARGPVAHTRTAVGDPRRIECRHGVEHPVRTEVADVVVRQTYDANALISKDIRRIGSSFVPVSLLSSVPF